MEQTTRQLNTTVFTQLKCKASMFLCRQVATNYKSQLTKCLATVKQLMQSTFSAIEYTIFDPENCTNNNTQ